MSDTKADQKVKVEERDLGFFINGMKVLWKLIGEQRNKMLVVAAWIVFARCLATLFPFILKLIVDEFVLMVQSGSISQYFILLVVTLTAVKLARVYISVYSVEFRFMKSLYFLIKVLPVKAQEKLLELSIGYHERENTGKKVAKIEKGCERVAGIFDILRWEMVPSFLDLAISTLVMLFIDWRIGLLFLTPFIPGFFLCHRGLKKTTVEWEKLHEEAEASSGLLCQSIINVGSVQSCVQERYERKKLRSLRDIMEKRDLKASKIFWKYMYSMNVLLEIFFILTIMLSVYLAFVGEASIGTVIFIMMAGQSTSSVIWNIVNKYMDINRNLVAVVRLKTLLDEEPEVKNSLDAIKLKNVTGKISVENARFKYPGKNKAVLNGVNINIEPGKMIAFVGPSGEGKTTAVKLICRMMDVESGSIKLDGVDIRDLDLYWYRKLFAIVQQDIDIFDCSLLDNVRYAYPKASEEQVQKALKVSHLHVILSDKDRFPKGIHEKVGERGVKLSGGERQRVGIARAYLSLLNGARVLVLDEATSSLDSESEFIIQSMIDKLRRTKNISIIAIAHRLSTIKSSDMIHVINGGKVVEKASHSELMKRKEGLYNKLVRMQRLAA